VKFLSQPAREAATEAKTKAKTKPLPPTPADNNRKRNKENEDSDAKNCSRAKMLATDEPRALSQKETWLL
jgi:hypothetical protein